MRDEEILVEIRQLWRAVNTLSRRTGVFACELDATARKLRKLSFAVSRPSVPSITPISKTLENSMKTITFDATLAAEADSTTTTRELSVKIGDAAPVIQTVPVSQTAIAAAVKGPVGAVVHVEQVDIDELGNRSQPAVLDFTITDCLPPVQPGVPSFSPVSEAEEA